MFTLPVAEFAAALSDAMLSSNASPEVLDVSTYCIEHMPEIDGKLSYES